MDQTRRVARAAALAESDLTMLVELVELRRKSPLTQEDVARALGITQQAVSAFERLESDPRLSTIRQYAHAVGALVAHDVRPDSGTDAALDWLASRHSIRITSETTERLERTVLGPRVDSARTDFALVA